MLMILFDVTPQAMLTMLRVYYFDDATLMRADALLLRPTF